MHSVFNVKVLVSAFNQEKALVVAFSVLTNLRMELFQTLKNRQPTNEGNNDKCLGELFLKSFNLFYFKLLIAPF